jgi:hypothetical protein
MPPPILLCISEKIFSPYQKVIAKKTKTIVELEEEAPPATRGEVLEWKKTVVSCLLNNRDTVIRVLKLKNENFNRLTEATDTLMSAGYYGWFSNRSF